MATKVLELVLKWADGGVEHYVEDLVGAAAKAGIRCEVASVTTGINSIRIDGAGPLVHSGVKAIVFQGKKICSYIKNNNYDVVHIHGNNGLAFYLAHLAAKAGAKAIVHSHNSAFGKGLKSVKALFTDLARKLYAGNCSYKFACSRAAGDFLFCDTDYKIALNGVDTKRFAFDQMMREELRSKLGVPLEAPVLGFAASLVEAKNPLFALEVFSETVSLLPDTYFIVCGDGELLDSFKAKAYEAIESGRCICVGRVADIEDYYDAMDVLIAPSLYEGLPINLIEAQANGLFIVMSDAVTDEVAVIPNLCKRLPLDAGVEVWASAVSESLGAQNLHSSDNSTTLETAGFSQPGCYKEVFDAYAELIGDDSAKRSPASTTN